jgi:hypothetical protein
MSSIVQGHLYCNRFGYDCQVLVTKQPELDLDVKYLGHIGLSFAPLSCPTSPLRLQLDAAGTRLR